MDVGRGLTNLRVELGISAKHEYGLKYFVSDIMCGARTKKTWDFYNTKRYKHAASSDNRSERCIPIKLLVTTFDNSNSYWNCHFIHIK